jgi:glutamate racemase
MQGGESRHLRVMTITGNRAKAQLLVVPCETSMALAVMVLRQAADLPVMYAHQHTTAFHTARAIVRTARAQHAPAGTPVEAATPAAP